MVFMQDTAFLKHGPEGYYLNAFQILIEEELQKVLDSGS